MIYIVNFPFCNFFSLQRYLRVRNKSYQVLAPGDRLLSGDQVILPGVGTYEQAMLFLRDQDFLPILQSHIDHGGQLLGICLGMQLLFEFSEESPGVPGLGLLPGGCVPIPPAPGFRVPHIGWNHLITPPEENMRSSLFGFSSSSICSHADYYFVHSYVAEPSLPSITTACFQHPTGPLCASVASSNISGVQFHPEKSGAEGYALLDKLLTKSTTA